MQSFLITAKDKNKASSYISDFLKEKEIYPIDVSQQIYEKTMGIEDVRSIQKKILLKPFKGKTKAVVIQAYENITTEAQNALLKVLEEPPNNTIIILTTTNKELLLPTILSRCKIIELIDKAFELSKQEVSQYLDILTSLSSIGVGDKLKLAQDVAKNKEEVIPWLEKMILVTRQKLLSTINHQPSTSPYLNILISLQKSHTVLKTTNVTQRIALENLFLNL